MNSGGGGGGEIGGGGGLVGSNFSGFVPLSEKPYPIIVYSLFILTTIFRPPFLVTFGKM